ncbi:Os11g0656500 [Oryza sativa Japonica Group]|uniref:Os11g0656500 protein n=2 Tax=Oryza sativa subsp. japonica TaxID=39947 RepID=Q2R072_ORYSJ|nr:retrotransposon protein, putative, unclassified, expressed [Oryza sativa Japonica Group]BAF28754.2 Os11g0656500 [Oryza sativa Japonica Group]BAT15107.1 Os11g0656500 [Oryza sativa Japonica Group]|eukprot:NP_001068391.2 Os11g0656500 [Oryza sativa Japonica Group]
MPRRRSSSPIVRTPHDSGGRATGSGGGDRGLVIHRVVKEGGGSVNYPLLTKTNYNDWALLMKIKLQARCLWAAIEPDGVDVPLHEDRMALDAICSAVPPEMIGTLATKASAREAWECIKTMRVGNDRIRKASAQKVRSEYESLAFRGDETVEDFALRLTTIVNQLATLGDPEPADKVVEKYLRVARPRFNQLILSIETLLDISTLSMEEVTGRLKAAEDSGQSSSHTADGKLYLTEEEWAERQKKKDQEAKRGDSGGSGGRGKRRGGRGRTGGGGTASPESTNSGSARKGDKFRNCGKLGHWAKDCRSKSKREEQAHVAQEDEEEHTLMLLTGGCVDTVDAAAPEGDTPTPPHQAVVELVEMKVFAALDDAADHDPGRWIMDSGASNHMTGSRMAFADLDTNITGNVRLGDGSVVRIAGRGTILFACKNEDGIMRVWDEQRRLLARIPRTPGRLYMLDINLARPVCLAAHADEDAWRWHARLGHINFRALCKMGKEELVRGLPCLSQVDQVCEACLARKHRRSPFPRQALCRSDEPLALLHGDLCGPITPATPSGNRYFLLLVDDYSRYMWVALLSTKDAAPAAIKRIQAVAERKSGRKLRALRTDRGGEFTSTQFAEYCAELGMRRELTAPYSPQQNGVVERRNQSVVGTARSMLKVKGLPGMFWGEAINTAVYLLNRSSSKGIGGKTPYALWNGVPPAVHHLRTFGCVAHVKTTTPNLKKLDDRSRPMIFVGYEPGSKAYRAYDPATRRVHISRDIVFDEAAQWDWDAEAAADLDTDFVVEYTTVYHPGSLSGTRQDAGEPPARSSSSPQTPSDSPTAGRTPSVHGDAPAVEFVSPPTGAAANLDADHDDAPLRFRTMDNVLGPAMLPGLANREVQEELMMVSGEEPATFAQAERDEDWRRAMLDEISSIEENKTWRLVDLPSGHRPIGLKWVYKLKKDAQGVVVKHKARLVAKGYVQRAGIDFDEVFAPVARLDSVRLLLALAAQEGWMVHHMDVKSAFLNGELIEEVYVVQPPGFEIDGQENKVYRLDKALYGLRQAPRAWNTKLDCTLKKLGFKQSPLEHGLYARGDGSGRLLVGVYVDDLVIVGGDSGMIKGFKEQMKAEFKMSDLGPLSFYLGIEVHQEAGIITLKQAAYASRIVEKAGLTGCNPCATPMEPRLKLSKESAGSLVDATEYRSLVGSLRYLVNTRPDLAYSVGYVSRFMEKPTDEHLAAVKRIIRYVAGTIHLGCRYVKEVEGGLQGYSDSDMAGDIDTRKSTTGVIFFLGKNPVSWQSQKQRVVALSSCESEYIAAATAACQGIWLARLLGDLRNAATEVVDLRVDNQSALALMKNPVFHDRSKHIQTKFHFIREAVENGEITPSYIGTEGQLADILTKPLSRIKFQELREKRRNYIHTCVFS